MTRGQSAGPRDLEFATQSAYESFVTSVEHMAPDIEDEIKWSVVFESYGMRLGSFIADAVIDYAYEYDIKDKHACAR